MKNDAPLCAKAPWETVVLVCRDCKKRSKGPRGLKGKAVVSELKTALRELRPRPRIVSSGCLGVCPKGALAIAAAGGAAVSTVLCVESLGQVAAAAPTLFGGSS